MCVAVRAKMQLVRYRESTTRKVLSGVLEADRPPSPSIRQRNLEIRCPRCDGMPTVRARRRAQDGHRAVRRHQGIDRARAGPRSRRSARDRRPRAQADDRRGASLRRLHRAIDRRRHLRAVRRAGRARGPSAARTVCGAADAGGAETLRGKIARDRESAARSARRCEHRRGCGAFDHDRRRTYRIHADRPHDQSRLADAGARADRLDRNQ